MSTAPRDDDPTHALDDFVRRMRPPAPRAADALPDLPDLSGLQDRLHPQRAAARPRGGTLRSGQTWSADEVVDVPELSLPRQPAPRIDSPQVTLPVVDLRGEQARAAQLPEIALPALPADDLPDAAALDASTRAASAAAAAQWDAEAQAGPAWQPDPQALQLRRAADPRLLAQWRPGAWLGAVREVFASTTEFVTAAGGTAVETYAPHRLLLLWPPQRLDAPTPGRWPQQVQLSALPAGQAGAALLALVPGDAPLWLMAAADDTDWALAAEIALHHDTGLRPFQTEGLRAFIAAERDASFARLNADYRQPATPGPVIRR